MTQPISTIPITRVLALLQIARRELENTQQRLSHTVWTDGRIDAEKERHHLHKLGETLQYTAKQFEEGEGEEP